MSKTRAIGFPELLPLVKEVIKRHGNNPQELAELFTDALLAAGDGFQLDECLGYGFNCSICRRPHGKEITHACE